MEAHEEGRVDGAEYRAKAREMRERAATTHDLVMHGEFLLLAEQYELLAKHVEAGHRG